MNLLQMIDQMINSHESGSEMMCNPHTQQHVTLKGPHGADDIRTIDSFPGGNVNVSLFALYPIHVL